MERFHSRVLQLCKQAIHEVQKLSLSKLGQVQYLSCENLFYLLKNKKYSHINGFTLSLVVKERLGQLGNGLNIATKESIYIRKEFNSHRTGLEHQYGRRFIVLGHQYGRRDVI